MQRNLQPRQTRFSWLRVSTTLCAVSATLSAAGCAVQPVAVDKAWPTELVQPELPAWRQWSQTYTNWLKRATEDGKDAPVEKTP